MQKLIKDKGDYADLTDYLAERLSVGSALLLEGDLGVGKTHFVGLLIRRLRGDDNLHVPSPTFALVHLYEGTPPIYHYDLYRLKHERELLELGLEEAYGRGIVLVEWPQILGDNLPADAWRLTMQELPDGVRQVDLHKLA